MIRIIVVGAAGRMGRRLVALTGEDPELTLAAAVEYEGNPLIGQDAGMIADGNSQNVAITSNLAEACKQGDIVIDFSSRDGGRERLQTVVAAGCGYVLGTTGFTEEEKSELRELAAGGRFVFAYNFSVGVNLLFALCEKVGRILGDDYDIEVIEAHHNQKVDSPSGTAERLGEILAEARGLNYVEDTRHGRQGIVGKRTKKEIGMHAVRGGDIVGEHTVIFATGGERIELTHKASSRDTFTKGALRAAKFLATAKPGEYDMRDILGLNQ